MENIRKRNEDFFSAVCRNLNEGALGRSTTSLHYAVKKTLTGGAPSFYLTREHVWKQLQERRRRLPPREKPHRRRMWDELGEALHRRRSSHPHEDAWISLDYVLSCYHPSGFFLTEPYAMRLVYRMMKKHGTAGLKPLKKQ
jgi:hypothetical protein